MAQMNQQKRRRRRGVILTSQGWEKLQQAKSKAEFHEQCGNRYTLEALSLGKNLLKVTQPLNNTLLFGATDPINEGWVTLSKFIGPPQACLPAVPGWG